MSDTSAGATTPAADAPAADKRTPQDYAKLVEVLLPTVNGVGQRVQALWFSFVSFGAYLTVAVLGTTHRMLLLEEPVKMPLLNIDLPLASFYLFAPGLLIVFHFYFLIQLVLLARTASEFETALVRAQLNPAESATLRMRLDNSIFVQLLIGADPERRGRNYWFIAPMAWLTTLVMPIALLVLMQLQFLPYHAPAVTYLHRCAITLDLILMLILWPAYAVGNGLLSWPHLPDRTDRKSTLRAALRLGVLVLPSIAILVLVWCVAVFSTEAMYRNWVTRLPGIAADAAGEGSWLGRLILSARDQRFVGNRPVSTFSFTEILFEPKTNYVSGTPGGLFANAIILPDRSFVDDKMVRDLDQAEQDVAAGRHRAIRSFRGRDLAGAILPRTDLRRSDFTGADMRGVTLVGASLQKSLFGCATDANGDALLAAPKTIDRATCARLNGALLVGANLEEAYLSGAVLSEANLVRARLGAATLGEYGHVGKPDVRAVFDGAIFDGADLGGVSFQTVSLIGAKFYGSNLLGTDFEYSDLRGATITDANPIAASFNGAKLRGAMIENSSLHGADFSSADVEGASILGASGWRVRGAPHATSSASIGVDSEQPDFLKPPQFDAWRKKMLDNISNVRARAAVEKALAVLDPSVKNNQAEAFSDWRKTRGEKPDDADKQKKLAEEFTGLACDPQRGPGISHNLIHSSAPRAMGPNFPAFAHMILRANDPKSQNGARDCPGAVGLSKDGLQRLNELLKRDPDKPE